MSLVFSASISKPFRGRIRRNQIPLIEPLNCGADIRVCRVADILVGSTLASLRASKLLMLRRLENLRHGRQECLRYVRFMDMARLPSSLLPCFLLTSLTLLL